MAVHKVKSSNYSTDVLENYSKEQVSIKYESEKTTKKEVATLNVLSLFSGCGGMDLGFEGGFLVNRKAVETSKSESFIDDYEDATYARLKPTKFKTVFANDILDDARKAWVHNFQKKGHSSNIFHSESIVSLVKLHESGVEVFPKDVDIVTGGFPCQDFSVAGKRNGFKSHKNHDGNQFKENYPSEETRGKLYYWMKKVVEIIQPKMFIAENVKGLVNLSNVKEVIQKDFASANGNGYIVLDPQVLHSANYGVPQSRERVFFIGIKKSALNGKVLQELSKKKLNPVFNPYPPITHDKLKGEFVKLKDIFKDLEEPENSTDLSQMYYSKAKFMGKHCQGQTEVNIEKIGPTIRAEHHGNIEFRRLSSENGGRYQSELKNGNKERRLTVRECALIQSFPPDYEFVIESSHPKRKFFLSPSKAYKVIGNAVPPLLAYNLAKRIESLWDVYFVQE